MAATRAEPPNGPIIHNRPQRQHDALVSHTRPIRWIQEYSDAPMRGKGDQLSVPAPDLTGPTGLYWAVRPRIVGDLCPVRSVAALVHIARSERLRRLR
ncbi:hypothetical protein ABZ921_07550 [Streptomyces atriruber]|uniref:Uncharacterized protein n=1 Tax=Streptomyces atriruber TaxID=545121 RepID=A0ABV3BHI4_9ACTN